MGKGKRYSGKVGIPTREKKKKLKGKFIISPSARKADGEGKAIFRKGWYSNPRKKKKKKIKGKSIIFASARKRDIQERLLFQPEKKKKKKIEREIHNFAFREESG